MKSTQTETGLSALVHQKKSLDEWVPIRDPDFANSPELQ